MDSFAERYLQPSNTWEEEADGRYWERREEKREVGWTMDIEKTCLDQATFEVGAHNVRGVTSKNSQEV